MVPHDVDVDRYDRDGYYISPAILEAELMTDLREGVNLYHRGVREGSVELDPEYLNWIPSTEKIGVNDYVVFLSSHLRRLLHTPVIGAIAARLMRTREVRLFNSAIVYKAPSSGEAGRVGWHNDKAYWRQCSSERMLTAWIPLYDVGEGNGALCVLPGSHRWPRDTRASALADGKYFFSKDGDPAHTTVLEASPVPPVALSMHAGQVSFHHCRTIHGSGPNTSSVPRNAIVLHLQDADNRFVTCENYRRYSLDNLVRVDDRGLPDYSDPVYCPRLWPAAESLAGDSRQATGGCQ